METYLIIKTAVQRGQARELAQLLGVSEDLVRRWGREPHSEDNPFSTGARNPIDRMDALFLWCLVNCPEMAEAIAERYNAKLKARYAQHADKMTGTINLKSAAAQALKEGAESLSAVIEEKPLQETMTEWFQFKEKMEVYLRTLEARGDDPAEKCQQVGLRKVVG